MGQTRVDLLHLLEDLRDAYPGALEETILTEIVANSLDSGATRISLLTDASQAVLAAVDDGSGMGRRDLARYHDIAASRKTRGEGIGFAGVGIKLGLLVCEEVLTETRRGDTHVATRWRLASRHKAPWRWVEPPGFVDGHGTSVCLRLRSPLSPLLDRAFIEVALRRHFQPMFETTFIDILSTRYPSGVEFRIDGRALEKRGITEGDAPVEIRLPRKRRAAAFGYLRRASATLAEDQRGIAVSTMGKVIRRGWDWIGLAPAAPELVCGLVEAPELAAVLTLNKADFIRVGRRGMTYLAYRKAIQEAIAGHLAEWGESRATEDRERRRAARPLERDLETVLIDLAQDFPVLSTLVERHGGGQRKLPMARAEGTRDALIPVDGPSPRDTSLPASDARTDEATLDTGPAATRSGEGPRAAGIASLPPAADPSAPKRPARYGLGIQFEERTDSGELGRLIESTVWVNTAHPAHARAVASNAEGYHIALTVAMALAPLAVEANAAHGFVTAFLARWGEALARDGRRRRGRPTRRTSGGGTR